MTHTQPSLFPEPIPAHKPKLARSRDPQSSHDAARELEESGGLSRQCAEVLRFLMRHPGKTTAELGALHETMNRHVFGRRMSNLKQLGYVRPGAKRKCTVGRPGLPWFPTGKALERSPL